MSLSPASPAPCQTPLEAVCYYYFNSFAMLKASNSIADHGSNFNRGTIPPNLAYWEDVGQGVLWTRG